MTIKKIAFTGLLLSSAFLVACQPQDTDPEADTLMMEETAPAVDEENIMMEGTDQPIPGEEEMLMENNDALIEETASPTASPMMETETDMEMETDTTM